MNKLTKLIKLLNSILELIDFIYSHLPADNAFFVLFTVL